MGNFLIERLKLVFLWSSIGIDLFGFYKICDEVKKRIIFKVYGVIFNCLGIRVVYLDIVVDYSIDKFLMVFRWFVLLYGYLFKLFLDNGI